jgi:hypothetical protein
VSVCFAVVMLVIEISYQFSGNGGEIMHVKHLLDNNLPFCLKKFIGKETPFCGQ